MGKPPARTDPELWEQVKKEVTRSSKGGRPGQWSARKAQVAVQIYRERGGGYVGQDARTGGRQRSSDPQGGGDRA